MATYANNWRLTLATLNFLHSAIAKAREATREKMQKLSTAKAANALSRDGF